MTQLIAEPTEREALDRLLDSRGLSGLWNVKAEDRTSEPKTTVRPKHANGSSQDEAILFSLHDTPVLEAFGLYREEGQS
jgi:hypothetical protein